MSKIVEKNILTSYEDDAISYDMTANFDRAIPELRDGLKISARRILNSLIFHLKRNLLIKTNSVIGKTMEVSHPHGDTSIATAITGLTQSFTTNYPLLSGHGNWGNVQGDPPAAPRYTSLKLSKFAEDVLVKDLEISKNVTDYIDTYNGMYKEVLYLPASLPLLLINGTYGIGYGIFVHVPSHNLNEVIDATLTLIDNPSKKIILIPDQVLGADIIDTNFKSICNTGHGNYKVMARIDIVKNPDGDGYNYLVVKNIPDLTSLNAIDEKIKELVEKGEKLQIEDIINKSGETNIDYWIKLKRGADPEYNRGLLYKYTQLQKTYPINLYILDGLTLKRLSYRQYLLNWINYRCETKYRLYISIIQEASTKYFEREVFVKVLESGFIDEIISKIKSANKSSDNELMEYLIHKFKITESQAIYLMNVSLKMLNKNKLNRYKEDMKRLDLKIKKYQKILESNDGITNEIKKELIELKEKYGRKRRSKLISEIKNSKISNNLYKIIISNNNYIKKININEPISHTNNFFINIILDIRNDDDLIIFCENGTTYSLPIYSLPLVGSGDSGIDLQFISKNITSKVLFAIPSIYIEKMSKKIIKSYLNIITEFGNIKRVDVKDFLNISKSGTFYINLNENDKVVSINLINSKCDIFVYSNNVGLLLDVDNIPIQKRLSKGVCSIERGLSISGMVSISNNCSEVLIITRNGYINRLNISSLKKDKRGSKPVNFINLSSSDSIYKIIGFNNNNLYLNYMLDNGDIERLSIDSIKKCSTLSKGKKYIKNKNIIDIKIE